jgi:formate hydrogenlyase subunit 4
VNEDALRAAALAVLQAAGMLAVAPLLRGGIKKMKARLQNRQGPPLLQGYYDLAKLLRKEPVRSETATWIYVAGPRLYFAAAVAATTLVPVLMAAAPLEATGGILLLVGTLALGRFALATAALDTGSPFGGMGASREMTIAALAEPALMLGLFATALAAGSLNLGALVRGLLDQGMSFHPSDLLALAGLFIILIAETGRIPVDNPATHLELTMIHEAMVLEYSGPDLALVEWASALKELSISRCWRSLLSGRHRHDRGAALAAPGLGRQGRFAAGVTLVRARTPSCVCSSPELVASRWAGFSVCDRGSEVRGMIRDRPDSQRGRDAGAQRWW